MPPQLGGEMDAGHSLGRTLDKFITYVYSGNLPMLDLSSAFAIPCANIDMSTEDGWGKFEFGEHGRYGHSMTPFTLMAMMTPNLPGDRDRRNALCAIDDEETVDAPSCPEDTPKVISKRTYQGKNARATLGGIN